MMNEYVRKQDAIDDLHTQLMYRMGSDDMKRRLDDWVTTLPSADVVQVVRCKDCRKCSYDSLFDHWWCNMTLGTRRVKHDDFCSYGERKE
jgi:hypothetical protein